MMWTYSVIGIDSLLKLHCKEDFIIASSDDEAHGIAYREFKKSFPTVPVYSVCTTQITSHFDNSKTFQSPPSALPLALGTLTSRGGQYAPTMDA